MPTPTNPQLYQDVKEKIMKSYKKNSAFASGAIVKEYKRLGGKYKEDGEPRNLERWFDEKWIDINPVLGITDDNAYPVFRPTKRVNSKTPSTITEIPVKQKIKGENNLPKFLRDNPLAPKEKKGGMIVKADPFNTWNKPKPEMRGGLP
jgi:hypothetical protein